jgi:sulfatase modifying factor 1
MNSKLLRILLISALLVIFVAGCSSVTEVPAVAIATETKQAEAPAEQPATQVPPTVTATAEPPTATTEPTATEIPPTNTPKPSATPQPTVLPAEITDAHGIPMVLVPAGEFVMGSDRDQAAARPAHTVYLDDFYIDVYEVSQTRYKECLAAGGCELTPGTGELLNRPVWDEHPMMDITWYDAQEYCEWRGGSLPTEAQWEKAARGTDERKFPWGNEPVTCERARYGECGWMTAPIGTHPAGASSYGVQDMAGNAWELIYDWYQQDYYSVSPAENPTGPEEPTGYKSERGGAWFYEADLMTAIWRNNLPPTAHYLYVGFRCVIEP